MGAQPSKANEKNPSEEAEPQLSPPAGQEQSPVQCEDDPEPINPVVIDGNKEYLMSNQPLCKKGPKDDCGK